MDINRNQCLGFLGSRVSIESLICTVKIMQIK